MKANIALGSFEFNSVNYQFPEIAEDEDIYDRNWLTVNIVIADQYGKSSEFTDSCVLTWELQDAIEGLVDVLDGKSDEFEACFLEPYFAMSVKKTDNGFDFYAAYFDMRMGKSKRNLSAGPDYGSVEDYAAYHEQSVYVESSVQAEITRDELISIISGLSEEYNRYPER